GDWRPGLGRRGTRGPPPTERGRVLTQRRGQNVYVTQTATCPGVPVTVPTRTRIQLADATLASSMAPDSVVLVVPHVRAASVAPAAPVAPWSPVRSNKRSSASPFAKGLALLEPVLVSANSR